VRPQFVSAGGISRVADAYLFELADEGLADLRRGAEERGMHWLERDPNDDPVILGCYI
jgi:hypothetical protein